ncbi:MAG: hypothetical protein BWX95_02235 [Bacteroidetes bacterium ADurb.Bin141]|nr:MAG: hypothetical protein UZ10_BCD003000053 [Bacteroidetes bacterium OLB10]MBV6454435.1 hypothetical protein [Bacteroidia bacterium]MBX3106694.1 DUF1569 domain-containing protein [Bacteroidota bacterium]MCE7955111.1 DUF1569 domain-containing protein [Bacteroidetes bacterium CHB6]OQB60557.1 MAG: hypothetical protein BWX95_02235 [Bacteroidetes bacterium ADurb.Bin141]
MIKNIFDKPVVDEVINRINNLTTDSKPLWGKMSVSQMLAHCCVTYEFIYENKHPVPGTFKKILLKLFVKNTVVSDKPYKRNNPTAPEFLIRDNKNFETEKKRLIDFIERTYMLGAAHFENKESRSFGKLSLNEWNNMFYKHLDHHLGQFGV